MGNTEHVPTWVLSGWVPTRQGAKRNMNALYLQLQWQNPYSFNDFPILAEVMTRDALEEWLTSQGIPPKAERDKLALIAAAFYLA